ncbi:MAG: carbohydrate binding domain-containing protein [Lachnospiraceae bacterium]|nr:carbohydrate binding domain-containing protein [Lachnospiraceae bacterium]
MDIKIVSTEGTPLSPYIFGHNLEHTRSAVGGGLSAQILKNRKFAGKPSNNRGVAAEWKGFGEHAFFELLPDVHYTRHIGCEKMRRHNELQSQRVQNMKPGDCGLMQQDLSVLSGRTYELRVVTQCSRDLSLKVELTDRTGSVVYAGEELTLSAGDWEITEFTLTPDTDDPEAVLVLRFSEQAMVTFGAVSMLPANHFHGMRSDVVRLLKEIGPSVLRWPGGNFAGEYRWKDGLMPPDLRGPLQAYSEIETQPHSVGLLRINQNTGTNDL